MREARVEKTIIGEIMQNVQCHLACPDKPDEPEDDDRVATG
jgi:hypothetical protein